MNKELLLRISHRLRDNVVVRTLAFPYFIIRKRLEVARFQKTPDSAFILSYKGKYAGKRCFIIGNGPSLCAEDLDKLKDEICFGCNRVYNIYPKTEWHPTFYMCLDPECIKDEFENIKVLKGSTKFIRIPGPGFPISERDKLHTFLVSDQYIINRSKHMKTDISTQCERTFSSSTTVTCVEIEFAIYMGFTEIYLLGVDHNYPIQIDSSGNTVVNNAVVSHFAGGGSKESSLHYIYIDAATQCYQVYRDYADAHGISIFNATRGGKLEVYKRADLDEVLTHNG